MTHVYVIMQEEDGIHSTYKNVADAKLVCDELNNGKHYCPGGWSYYIVDLPVEESADAMLNSLKETPDPVLEFLKEGRIK